MFLKYFFAFFLMICVNESAICCECPTLNILNLLERCTNYIPTLCALFSLSLTLTVCCFTVFTLLRGLQNLFKRSLDKRYISVSTRRVKECFKSLTNCYIPYTRKKRICLMEEFDISNTLARFTTAGYKKIFTENYCLVPRTKSDRKYSGKL